MWHTTGLRWPAIDNYSAWAEYDDEDAARWSAPRLGRVADYLLEPVLAGRHDAAYRDFTVVNRHK